MFTINVQTASIREKQKQQHARVSQKKKLKGDEAKAKEGGRGQNQYRQKLAKGSH